MKLRIGPSRILTIAAGVSVTAGVIFLFTTDRLASLMPKAGASAEEIEIAAHPVSFSVEANGLLKAKSVQLFGGPPAFANYWQFQVVSLVPEGQNVKKGDVLIAFDAQRIRDDLQRFQNELGQAVKELEKTKVQTDLERQELSARLATAENNYEKLALKQKTNVTIDNSIDIKVDELKLAQAKREVDARRQQLDWHTKSSEANYQILATRKARAENRVNQITKGMENFQAVADRDGVAVYKTKWNGERYQVGETIWSGQPLMEIPDLRTIVAEAYVPEVDVGKVQIGQTVEVTIDALPGKSYGGRVSGIGKLVRAKAWDIQNKILEVEVELDNLDTAIMRPGMSIKAKVVTATIDESIAVPIKAIRTTAEGSLVKLKTDAGSWQERKVNLGDSNGKEVIILDGLVPGQRIAADFSKAQQ